MSPLVTSALFAGVPALAKMGVGIGQKIKANKLSKTPRPVYQRPGEIDKYVQSSLSRSASPRIAGHEAIEQKLGAASANVMRTAQDAADPMAFLGAVSSAKGREQDAILDLGIAGAQDKARREEAANQALLTGAQYKDKEFEINELMPYQQAKAAESALRESGTQNLIGGITDLSGVASSMIGIGGGGDTKVTTGAVNDTVAGQQVTDPANVMNMSDADKNRLKIQNPRLYATLFPNG